LLKLHVINNSHILSSDHPLNIKSAELISGSLSSPSKMPGWGYGIPAAECKTGSKLRKVKGSVCEKCYAFKGNYTFKNVVKSQYKRFESLNDPNWVKAIAFLINKKVDKKDPYFRWHDAGDLQSVEHLQKIVDVCYLTSHVVHWLPTREYAIVNAWKSAGNPLPKNLTIRLSAHMIDGPIPNIDLPISSVSTKDTIYPDANQCPARHQNNECKDCRACWDSKVKHVSYHKH
jgi:hypothetical protein